VGKEKTRDCDSAQSASVIPRHLAEAWRWSGTCGSIWQHGRSEKCSEKRSQYLDRAWLEVK
jgi:hypothetical protein